MKQLEPTDKRTRRAAFYCRVSTDDQRKNYSVPSQIQACREYAESKGYKLVGDWIVDPDTGLDASEGVAAYVDDISSSVANRPALDAAYSYAAKYGFDVLVVHQLDRLGRSSGMIEILEAQLQEFGVSCEYVLGGYEKSAEGDLHKDMSAMFSNYENRKRTERTNRGKRQKAKTGLVVGKPPYGYVKNADGIGGVVVVPGEADIINRIFALFTSGQSIRGIARTLNADGVVSPLGGSWGKSSIHKILNRGDYTGKATYNRTRRVGKRRVENPKDEWIEIPIPSIISDGIFNKAAAKLEHNKNHRRTQHKRFYLLSGLIYCSECGKPYMPEAAPAGRNRRKNDYKYYRHRGAKNGCVNRQVSARMIEELLVEIFYEYAEDPEMLQTTYENYVADLKAQDANKYNRLETLDVEISRAQKKRGRYIELYTDGLISKPELETRLHSVDGKIKSANARRDSIEITHIPSADDMSTFEGFIAAFKEDAGSLTVQDIRKALLNLGAELYVSPNDDGEETTGLTEFRLNAGGGLLSQPSTNYDPLQPRPPEHV